MDRSDVLYAAAIIVAIGVFLAILSAINQRPDEPPEPAAPSASAAANDLPAELRRCSLLGPWDAEDLHCRAVWEENRHRFFGTSERSLPLAAAPAPLASGGGAP
jgi:conjugative transfer region protein TrbK